MVRGRALFFLFRLTVPSVSGSIPTPQSPRLEMPPAVSTWPSRGYPRCGSSCRSGRGWAGRNTGCYTRPRPQTGGHNLYTCGADSLRQFPSSSPNRKGNQVVESGVLCHLRLPRFLVPVRDKGYMRREIEAKRCHGRATEYLIREIRYNKLRKKENT